MKQLSSAGVLTSLTSLSQTNTQPDFLTFLLPSLIRAQMIDSSNAPPSLHQGREAGLPWWPTKTLGCRWTSRSRWRWRPWPRRDASTAGTGSPVTSCCIATRGESGNSTGRRTALGWVFVPLIRSLISFVVLFDLKEQKWTYFKEVLGSAVCQCGLSQRRHLGWRL